MRTYSVARNVFYTENKALCELDNEGKPVATQQDTFFSFVNRFKCVSENMQKRILVKKAKIE